MTFTLIQLRYAFSVGRPEMQLVRRDARRTLQAELHAELQSSRVGTCCRIYSRAACSVRSGSVAQSSSESPSSTPPPLPAWLMKSECRNSDRETDRSVDPFAWSINPSPLRSTDLTGSVCLLSCIFMHHSGNLAEKAVS